MGFVRNVVKSCEKYYPLVSKKKCQLKQGPEPVVWKINGKKYKIFVNIKKGVTFVGGMGMRVWGEGVKTKQNHEKQQLQRTDGDYQP